MASQQNTEVDSLTELTEGINEISLGSKRFESDWQPDEDYYVHIDILSGANNKIKTNINSFMIQIDSYDPRLAVNFPTDLMDVADREKERKAGGIHLGLRRKLAGVSPCRYEFWKVRKELFSLSRFQEMVKAFPQGVSVQIIRIIDNEHELTTIDADKDHELTTIDADKDYP